VPIITGADSLREFPSGNATIKQLIYLGVISAGIVREKEINNYTEGNQARVHVA
jgi:hypothetical protein